MDAQALCWEWPGSAWRSAGRRPRSRPAFLLERWTMRTWGACGGFVPESKQQGTTGLVRIEVPSSSPARKPYCGKRYSCMYPQWDESVRERVFER